MKPDQWDRYRAKNQAGYHRRYGSTPSDHPRVAAEQSKSTDARYERIAGALDSISRTLQQARPDALIIIADDQNENFSRANLPQIAIYTGDDFLTETEPPDLRRSEPRLASAIHTHAIERDIDMAELNSFPDQLLFAHAFGTVLRRIDPERLIPVIPIFINEIHVPAPSPSRCYYLGRVIGEAVRNFSALNSIALIASGGLSHFTAGYPWNHYTGPHTHGSIDESFDARVVEQIRNGEGHRLAEMTSMDLLDAGAIELRSWIALLGAIGAEKPTHLVYEPFYRGLMGMGVAEWKLPT